MRVCQCRQCLRDREEGDRYGALFIAAESQRIIVRPICGKRHCPHAGDHREECTGGTTHHSQG